MRDYTFVVTVAETRSYRVRAANAEDAEEVLRDEYRELEFDIIDNEIDNLEVQD